MDAHHQTFDQVSSWAGRILRGGNSDFITRQQASNALLALACLGICAAVFSSYFRQPRGVPSRGSIYALGVVLFFCGVSQLVNALILLPAYHVAVMPLLASIA